MIAKVQQNGSIVTVEFTGIPTANVVAKVKSIGMVQQSKTVFKGIINKEKDVINAINGAGVSVSTPDGYMGAGAWYGAKNGLYGNDLAKAIRTELKNAGIKATVRQGRGGWTDHITVTVTANAEDFVTYEQFRQEYDFFKVLWFSAPAHFGCGPDIFHKEFNDNSKYTDEQRDEIREYHVKKEYDYYMGMQELRANRYANGKMNDLMTDAFNEKLRLVQSILDSYNYDESNSQVDYFSVGFYQDLHIKNMVAVQSKKSA